MPLISDGTCAMSENNPALQPAAPAAKPRNPVEKVLVRGFIAVMLVLVAVENPDEEIGRIRKRPALTVEDPHA